MKRLLACVLLASLLLSLCPTVLSEEEKSEALQYGAQGETVIAIQEQLTALGYYTGKVSGNFLEGTRVAVKKFQKDYGLEATGTVDAETEALLMSAEYRVIREGLDGEDVTRLQQRLKDLGYFDREPTGKYRSITSSAVKTFQKAHGLKATGEADMDTQRMLYSDQALKKGAKPTPTPAPGMGVGDINDMVIAGDGEMMQEEVFSHRLTRGDKGEDVKKVQNRLKELGFFDGPVSGNYMDQTRAAVEKFQGHNGLDMTGNTDEATWNQMFNSQTVVDAQATPMPTPVPTPVPYAITVDVNNQVTTVYGLDDKGEYTVPVRRMICSTGTKATPSTVGEFTLTGRNARWCYFPSYNSHAQYWTKINDYIAFHSVIYREVDYNALDTKSYNKLGQRASHGCIRLMVHDSQWIYENIGKGVVVTITEDLPSDEELRKAVAKPALNSSKTGPVSTPEPTPEPEYLSGGMPPMPLRKLERDSRGEDVYWLQMKLKELGYYTGTVTGGYYGGTHNAVKAYQRANGLSVTGEANVRTLEHLYADVLATPEPMPESTPKPEE